MGVRLKLEPDKKLWVFNTHLHHRENQIALDQLRAALNYIDGIKLTHPGEPIFFVGDFNLSKIDSEFSEMMVMLGNDGFEEITHSIRSTSLRYTGNSFSEGGKIDYIFLYSGSSNIRVKKSYLSLNNQLISHPIDNVKALNPCAGSNCFTDHALVLGNFVWE